MAEKSGSGAVLATGVILLCVGGVAVGYGLNSYLNGMESGQVLLGSGAGLIGLALIFVIRSQLRSG